jgi:hypothetical protein
MNRPGIAGANGPNLNNLQNKPWIKKYCRVRLKSGYWQISQ